MWSPDRQTEDPGLALMSESPTQHSSPDIDMLDLQSPPGTPKTTNMEFTPPKTTTTELHVNEQMRLLPETTVVTDNRGLQVKDLEQEEQDHIVAKVCEQHCDPPYTLTTTNPHSLAKQYIQNIAIKINRMDNTANDESIMAIIQALLKAILNKVPSVQIIAPVTSKLLDPITRKQGNIPASIETRIIRRCYVHKVALPKDNFHGWLTASANTSAIGYSWKQ